METEEQNKTLKTLREHARHSAQKQKLFKTTIYANKSTAGRTNGQLASS